MKKKIITLLAVSVMVVMSVNASETQKPVSKGYYNTSRNVLKKEQQTNSQVGVKTKTNQEQTLNKKTKLQARAEARTKKQQLQEQKAKDRKIKVEAQKQKLRELFQ